MLKSSCAVDHFSPAATISARGMCSACRSSCGSDVSGAVCAVCLSKIAQFNAMMEFVDDALVGSERVVIPLPVDSPLLPHLPSVVAQQLAPRFAALWSGFPLFDGPMAEVDHLSIIDTMPDGATAGHHASSLPGGSVRSYRLVPRRLALPLAQLEYNLVELACEAFSQGLRVGRGPAFAV